MVNLAAINVQRIFAAEILEKYIEENLDAGYMPKEFLKWYIEQMKILIKVPQDIDLAKMRGERLTTAVDRLYQLHSPIKLHVEHSKYGLNISMNLDGRFTPKNDESKPTE